LKHEEMRKDYLAWGMTGDDVTTKRTGLKHRVVLRRTPWKGEW